MLKTWHFPTNMDGARDVPRLRHPHAPFVHARKHPSRFSTLGSQAVAVLNCRPLATSARLELAVLFRSGFPTPPKPTQLEPVLLKTWHFPTNMDGARDVPRLRHPHVPFVHARKHPSRFSTLGGQAVAVLNCQPLTTSARLELAVLLRSEVFHLAKAQTSGARLAQDVSLPNQHGRCKRCATASSPARTIRSRLAVNGVVSHSAAEP